MPSGTLPPPSRHPHGSTGAQGDETLLDTRKVMLQKQIYNLISYQNGS